MIRVQPEDFDVGLELNNLTDNNLNIGGVSCFIGLVRDMAGEKIVKSMTLEHYPEMTQKALVEIEEEALSRWQLSNTLIIHRYGKLNPGDQIVLVAAASAHRKAAIEATQFLIDWLKTKAPFWKLEETHNGEQWVEAVNSDKIAAKNWNKKR
jgi:molybdopterin synthase catalytic subunit